MSFYTDGPSRLLESKKAALKAMNDPVLSKLTELYLPEPRRCISLGKCGWRIHIDIEMDWMIADQYNLYVPFHMEEIYDIWIYPRCYMQ